MDMTQSQHLFCYSCLDTFVFCRIGKNQFDRARSRPGQGILERRGSQDAQGHLGILQEYSTLYFAKFSRGGKKKKGGRGYLSSLRERWIQPWISSLPPF